MFPHIKSMVIGSSRLSKNVSLFLKAGSHWSEHLSFVTIPREKEKYELHHWCFRNAPTSSLVHFCVCSKGLLLSMPFKTADG